MKPKIKIGMAQINNSFSNQDYLPYSIGLLQGFAQKRLINKDSFEFLLPIYKRIPIKVAVRNILVADIVFFSTYVWNYKISLGIAKEVKKNKPETIIVFGGPQVPSRKTEDFLRANPFIDIACHGEGEIIFSSILENCSKRDLTKVPSISHIDETGKFIRTPTCERISNLDDIPSPYLEGIFDPLIEINHKAGWVALWETNRGCPFSCAYCDWGSATKDKVYVYNVERLFREIDWFSQHKIEFVFCCDSNFGLLERDIEIVKYFAENKHRYGYPRVLSVQSTKNLTERACEIYTIMSDAGLNKGVSLSLQSLNESTLRYTRRKNISLKVFEKIQKNLATANIETFTDLILGLPGETYETFVDGASSVIENGQHNRIQFNDLSILANAEMGDPKYQKKFGLDIVESKIINIHGSLAETKEVSETQQLVVGTSNMPRADWVRAKVFGWVTSLLHFDKLLQIPFMILNNAYHISYRELIEIFTDESIKSPILLDIHSFFVNKAVDIQNGGAEFCESKKWLNIWWPADELILIKLCTENKLAEFHKEAQYVIGQYLKNRKISNYRSILDESIYLNQNLIRLPFQEKDLDIHLSYNLWDVYYGALRGIKVSLKRGDHCYRIERSSVTWLSWEDWCREVIWYGNKRGAYLYNCRFVDSKDMLSV